MEMTSLCPHQLVPCEQLFCAAQRIEILSSKVQQEYIINQYGECMYYVLYKMIHNLTLMYLPQYSQHTNDDHVIQTIQVRLPCQHKVMTSLVHY